MAGYSRREFLKTVFELAACSTLHPLINPGFVFAQSAQTGEPRNLILLNLTGGQDGLSLCPYAGTGPITTLINQTLRPTIHIPPEQVLLTSAQTGVPDPIGLHPAAKPSVGTVDDFSLAAAEHITIIRQIGIPVYPGGSHATCQLIYSLGSQATPPGVNKGWLAALMDYHDMDTFQLFGIGSSGDRPDFRAEKKLPLVLSGLGSYTYRDRSFGSYDPPSPAPSAFVCRYNDDSAHARKVAGDLSALQSPTSEISRAYSAAISTMKDSVSAIGAMNSRTVTGRYTTSSFGRNCADIAKVLYYKATQPELQNNPTLIYAERSGFDTHSSQLTVLTTNLSDVFNNLASLIVDLKAAGIWNQTVFYLFSEFGRTNRQNGGLGCDHAWASNHLVTGGSVIPQISGHDPSTTELTNKNLLTPSTDFRWPLKDCLDWLGLDSSPVLPEGPFPYERVVRFA